MTRRTAEGRSARSGWRARTSSARGRSPPCQRCSISAMAALAGEVFQEFEEADIGSLSLLASLANRLRKLPGFAPATRQLTQPVRRRVTASAHVKAYRPPRRKPALDLGAAQPSAGVPVR